MVLCSPGARMTLGPSHVKSGVEQKSPGGPGQAVVVPRIVPGLALRAFTATSNTLTPLASLTFSAPMLVASGMKAPRPIATWPLSPHEAILPLTVLPLPSLARRCATKTGPLSQTWLAHVSAVVQGLVSSQLLPSLNGAPGMQLPDPLHVSTPSHALPSSQFVPTGAMHPWVTSLHTFWHNGLPAHGLPDP